MIYCRTYDEARLTIIHDISNDTEYCRCEYKIHYTPEDKKYPYKVECFDFTSEELDKITKNED